MRPRVPIHRPRTCTWPTSSQSPASAKGQLVRRGVPGRLHPSDPGRARLRQGRDALHRPRGVHRLRRLRRGLPRGRLLRRGPAPGRVGRVRADQRRSTSPASRLRLFLITRRAHDPQRGHVEHGDRAALRLDPAEPAEGVQGLVDALAGGTDPAGELLLRDRKVDADAAARLREAVLRRESLTSRRAPARKCPTCQNRLLADGPALPVISRVRIQSDAPVSAPGRAELPSDHERLNVIDRRDAGQRGSRRSPNSSSSTSPACGMARRTRDVLGDRSRS